MKTKIQIKDLNMELMNLYFSDGSFPEKDIQLFESRVEYDKETGEEIGADLVLNSPVEGVQDIDEEKAMLNDYLINHRVSKSKHANRGLYWNSEEQALCVYISFKGTEAISSAAIFGEESKIKFEADFDELLKIQIEYSFSDFITDEQKKANFQFFMGRLAQANNFSKLKIVRESVLAGQKGKHGWFFFMKGDSKKFWDAYNLKKETLNKIKEARNAR